MAGDRTVQTFDFLPVNGEDMKNRGWDAPDFVYVTGDAYVDHPTFGTAIISRVLEAAGYRVAILAQPDFKSTRDFLTFGRPKLGFLVSAGNIDSMVAHYTVAKKKRSRDYYSPGGVMGKRPDRAVIVYCNRVREAFGDIPIIIGGIEASLRRFAHYDYWDNKVRRSVLVDAGADLLSYGMGEKSLVRIANLLEKGVPVRKIRDVRGTVFLGKRGDAVHFPVAASYDFDALKEDKHLYAEAFGVQYRNQDAISGKALVEYYGDRMLVQNPPMPPLEREELDKVYALPYARNYHPMYEKMGGVPAIEEVKFSLTHNRGCFGACNFCALAFHQGRTVRSRSIESVVKEAKLLTTLPDFKGYIHDVGGPTANFRLPACKKQLTKGVCPDRKCLSPTPCKNLIVDHSEYVELLRQLEAIPGVKKVFIRSGVRFDYLMADKDETFFRKLVRDHVSGQLKVAPEHCADGVLDAMGKPHFEVYQQFRRRFFEITKEEGKEQYLVPYLMSSHPGSTLKEAVTLAECLKRDHYAPEQVQDYYPTPGTASTVMYDTGINPLNMKPVFVPTEKREKQMQRALLQFNRPQYAALTREALRCAHREDLIGHGAHCLVPPEGEEAPRQSGRKAKKNRPYPPKRGEKQQETPLSKTGKPAAPQRGKSPVRRGEQKPYDKKEAPRRGEDTFRISGGGAKDGAFDRFAPLPRGVKGKAAGKPMVKPSVKPQRKPAAKPQRKPAAKPQRKSFKSAKKS